MMKICKMMTYLELDESMNIFADEFVEKVLTIAQERNDFMTKKYCFDIISMMLCRGAERECARARGAA